MPPSGSVTILAVTHRPALVQAADRVYRVDEGRVTLVEQREPGTALLA